MKKLVIVGLTGMGLFLAGGCSSDEKGPAAGTGGKSGSPEQTGAICQQPQDCYPKVDAGALLGQVQCLDRVPGGYCTHECTKDDDCCAVTGECETKLRQVCSPFESTGLWMCFLSCEDTDLVAPDGGPAPTDAEEFCQREASPYFTCRSTGGGSGNRKVCVPADCGLGASCAADTDCDPGLVCLPPTTFRGGYCGVKDCTLNADCPADSRCVRYSDGNRYCFRTCVTQSDCSLCRGVNDAASCRDDVEFTEATTGVSVCVPPAP